MAKLRSQQLNPNFTVTKKFPAVALLDADHAFGLAAGKKAVQIGEKLCDKNGISAVAVCNSSHPGALASIVLDSAKRGYLVFAFTNADSLLKSFNGTRAYFGTNPICFVAPRGKSEPYCLDMSNSIMTWNKVLNYKKLYKKLPKKIATNKLGLETINPEMATALLSIGGLKPIQCARTNLIPDFKLFLYPTRLVGEEEEIVRSGFNADEKELVMSEKLTR